MKKGIDFRDFKSNTTHLEKKLAQRVRLIIDADDGR
jgi:hypothetical protein